MTTPTAPSKPATPLQLLARTRRSIAVLAARPAVHVDDLAGTVPGIVREVMEADGRTDYVRSGSRYVESATYEYAWSFLPHNAALSGEVRAAADGLLSAARRADVTPAVAALADLQTRFSPRDPRIAWRTADGRLVIDEICRNYLPSGLLDQYTRMRISADLALGAAVAGEQFAGVRVLPLLRYRSEAVLATADEPLTCVRLDDSELAPDGDVVPAGLAR